MVTWRVTGLECVVWMQRLPGVVTESHAWKQEDTEQPRLHLKFTVGKQSLMFLSGKTYRRSLCFLPPLAFGCSSMKPDLHSVLSFSVYNIPLGRSRIFCGSWKKKDIVSGKLKVNTDPVDEAYTVLD